MANNRFISNKLKRVRANDDRTLLTRDNLSSWLGMSFGNDRSLYTAAGYPEVLTSAQFMARFTRQDIAKRIVKAPVRATWNEPPTIYDDPDPETNTAFEKAWEELVKARRVWHYIARADVLAGLSRYAVLFLGFGDGADWEKPLQSGELAYLHPYTESSATINTEVGDESDPRYGMPETYDINFRGAKQQAGRGTRRVHWTRVLHIPSDDVLECDQFGAPRLEGVYNRLQDIETILAGSTEAQWKGGFPGLAFKMDPEAQLGSQDIANMEIELKNYFHGLQRYLRLIGIDVQSIQQQIADPTALLMMELKMISGATGIPIRILIGSERGELASSQDDENWNDRIKERQTDHAEPLIVRPFVDRMIEAGVLPEPQGGEFFVDWPDIEALSDKEQADLGKVRADTIKVYCEAPGAMDLYPPEKFLTDIMNLDIEEVVEMRENLESMIEEEEFNKEIDHEKKEIELDHMKNPPKVEPGPGKGFPPK